VPKILRDAVGAAAGCANECIQHGFENSKTSRIYFGEYFHKGTERGSRCGCGRSSDASVNAHARWWRYRLGAHDSWRAEAYEHTYYREKDPSRNCARHRHCMRHDEFSLRLRSNLRMVAEVAPVARSAEFFRFFPARSFEQNLARSNSRPPRSAHTSTPTHVQPVSFEQHQCQRRAGASTRKSRPRASATSLAKRRRSRCVH
jgi:hypothetical protein